MKTRFKRISLGLLLGAGTLFFLLPSCDKAKDAAKVKVKYPLPDTYFTIDSLSHLKTEQLLYSVTYTANIDSILGANKGTLGNVSFYQLRLTVLSPDWVTLDWIHSARVTITPLAGQAVEVAKITSIDPGARTVDFEISNIDVGANINGPFEVRVYGDIAGPVPTEAVNMLLQSGIEITINLL
jgi:hypothetical protein